MGHGKQQATEQDPREGTESHRQHRQQGTAENRLLKQRGQHNRSERKQGQGKRITAAEHQLQQRIAAPGITDQAHEQPPREHHHRRHHQPARQGIPQS